MKKTILSILYSAVIVFFIFLLFDQITEMISTSPEKSDYFLLLLRVLVLFTISHSLWRLFVPSKNNKE
ncbi:MAG TPA: hypothetical protein VIG80_15400 [Bacillaceae bacterium]